MKTTILFKLSALIVCALMLAVCALPVSAKAVSNRGYFDEHDQEKLTAFWHQEAYDGLNNGEAVYDCYFWDPDNEYNPESNWYYHGSYSTPLLGSTFTSEGYTFHLGFAEESWEVDYDEFGEPIYLSGWKEYFPDLYGPLDLAETNLRSFGGVKESGSEAPIEGQTHITSVNVSNCEDLFFFMFDKQYYCESIEALGCPAIERFYARSNACTHLAFSMKDQPLPAVLDAVGLGHVGAIYNYTSTPDKVQLKAYPSAGKFIGWYENGQLVSTSKTYMHTGGGELIAYFGGDVDGDLDITTADALLALRSALGLDVSVENVNAIDFNSNGEVDTIDALTILRLAMGIY